LTFHRARGGQLEPPRRALSREAPYDYIHSITKERGGCSRGMQALKPLRDIDLNTIDTATLPLWRVGREMVPAEDARQMALDRHYRKLAT